MNKFAERLKQKLKEKGMTQRDLARKLGVPDRTVSQWTTGRCIPRNDNLFYVAEILECDIEWLKGNDRAGNRNSSGNLDPTAYEAIKNIENEEKKVEIKRGEIYEYNAPNGITREVLILSANYRKEDYYHNAIFLYKERDKADNVPIICSGTKYVDCEKVSLIKSEFIGSFIGIASDEEMTMIDAGVAKALNIEHKRLVVKDTVETDRLNESIRMLLADAKAREEECKALEAQLEEARNAKVDSAELIELRTERNMYKKLYEQLFERLVS